MTREQANAIATIIVALVAIPVLSVLMILAAVYGVVTGGGTDAGKGREDIEPEEIL